MFFVPIYVHAACFVVFKRVSTRWLLQLSAKTHLLLLSLGAGNASADRTGGHIVSRIDSKALKHRGVIISFE